MVPTWSTGGPGVPGTASPLAVAVPGRRSLSGIVALEPGVPVSSFVAVTTAVLPVGFPLCAFPGVRVVFGWSAPLRARSPACLRTGKRVASIFYPGQPLRVS